MYARPRKRERKFRRNPQRKFPLNEIKDEEHEDFRKS
jgi:hypothetical protein